MPHQRVASVLVSALGVRDVHLHVNFEVARRHLIQHDIWDETMSNQVQPSTTTTEKYNDQKDLSAFRHYEDTCSSEVGPVPLWEGIRDVGGAPGPSIGFDSGHTRKTDSITAARSFVALVLSESAPRSAGPSLERGGQHRSRHARPLSQVYVRFNLSATLGE